MLRANENKVTTESDFNRVQFGIKTGHESSNDKKLCFRY